MAFFGSNFGTTWNGGSNNPYPVESENNKGGGWNAEHDYSTLMNTIFKQANGDDWKRSRLLYDTAASLAQNDLAGMDVDDSELKENIDKHLNRLQENDQEGQNKSAEAIRADLGMGSGLLGTIGSGINKINKGIGTGLDWVVDTVGGDMIGKGLLGSDEIANNIKNATKGSDLAAIPSLLEDVGLSLIPGVGVGLMVGKNVLEQGEGLEKAATGIDPITGQKLDDKSRLATLGASAIPIGLSAIPLAGKIGKGIFGKAAAETAGEVGANTEKGLAKLESNLAKQQELPKTQMSKADEYINSANNISKQAEPYMNQAKTNVAIREGRLAKHEKDLESLKSDLDSTRQYMTKELKNARNSNKIYTKSTENAYDIAAENLDKAENKFLTQKGNLNKSGKRNVYKNGKPKNTKDIERLANAQEAEEKTANTLNQLREDQKVLYETDKNGNLKLDKNNNPIGRNVIDMSDKEFIEEAPGMERVTENYSGPSGKIVTNNVNRINKGMEQSSGFAEAQRQSLAGTPREVSQFQKEVLDPAFKEIGIESLPKEQVATFYDVYTKDPKLFNEALEDYFKNAKDVASEKYTKIATKRGEVNKNIQAAKNNFGYNSASPQAVGLETTKGPLRQRLAKKVTDIVKENPKNFKPSESMEGKSIPEQAKNLRKFVKSNMFKKGKYTGDINKFSTMIQDPAFKDMIARGGASGLFEKGELETLSKAISNGGQEAEVATKQFMDRLKLLEKGKAEGLDKITSNMQKISNKEYQGLSTAEGVKGKGIQALKGGIKQIAPAAAAVAMTTGDPQQVLKQMGVGQDEASSLGALAPILAMALGRKAGSKALSKAANRPGSVLSNIGLGKTNRFSGLGSASSGSAYTALSAGALADQYTHGNAMPGTGGDKNKISDDQLINYILDNAGNIEQRKEAYANALNKQNGKTTMPTRYTGDLARYLK